MRWTKVARLRRGLRRLVCWLRQAPDIPPGVTVSEGAYIGRGVIFDYGYAHHITIEAGATIVSDSMILCHDASSFRRLGVTWVAPVRVCGGAYIGARAILLPGVTIGEGAVVGAGAVVGRDVPAGAVVAGVPARQLETTEELDARRLALLRESDVFDSTLFKGAALTPERTILLEQTIASKGGYFVARGASVDRASRGERRRTGQSDAESSCLGPGEGD
jgi:maltose O-acetyltransferase